DLDRRDVSCRGRGTEYRIVGLAGGKLAARLRRQTAYFGVNGARDLAESHGTVRARDGDAPIARDKIAGRGFEQMGGGIDELFAHGGGGERGGAAGEHHAAACIGAAAAPRRPPVPTP